MHSKITCLLRGDGFCYQRTVHQNFLNDFLIYLTTIKGKSKRTRKEYKYDLTLFLKYIIILREGL